LKGKIFVVSTYSLSQMAYVPAACT